jgi:excisionase family DNA binding protein
MQQESDPLDVLTVEEVASKLKLTRLSVRRMLYDGRLRAYKIGKEWRLRRQDVIDWMESNCNLKSDK